MSTAADLYERPVVGSSRKSTEGLAASSTPTVRSLRCGREGGKRAAGHERVGAALPRRTSPPDSDEQSLPAMGPSSSMETTASMKASRWKGGEGWGGGRARPISCTAIKSHRLGRDVLVEEAQLAREPDALAHRHARVVQVRLLRVACSSSSSSSSGVAG